MNKNVKYEFAILGILVLSLLIGVIYSGNYARQERRDGVVREELRELKHQVEMYFNDNEQYPLEWATGRHSYIITTRDGNQAASWYVSGQLENKGKPSSGIDEEYNINWRVTKQGKYEICGGEYICE